MIIGLTGTLASGKGVIADFLKERGFVYLSLSNELREIAKEQKIELTRKNLQDLGSRLRLEKGGGVLADIVLKKILDQKYSNVIIDGIRNPAEVHALKKLRNFFLVSVDAPREVRFKRIIERNRESDPKDWESFLLVDARDLAEEEESGQQVGKCMELADFSFINNDTLENTKNKVGELYGQILSKVPRPDWDEYFIKLASLVGERSTCLRHHVGAVIVKGKRALTTGYNGAAKGMKDCTELGCMRDELKIPSGTRHEICRAIHAEQNAIIQAGVHGINIEGGTIYSTHTPCMICAKMIVNSGIKEVVSYQDYSDESARNFLANSGVVLRKVERPIGSIEFRD